MTGNPSSEPTDARSLSNQDLDSSPLVAHGRIRDTEIDLDRDRWAPSDDDDDDAQRTNESQQQALLLDRSGGEYDARLDALSSSPPTILLSRWHFIRALIGEARTLR